MWIFNKKEKVLKSFQVEIEYKGKQYLSGIIDKSNYEKTSNALKDTGSIDNLNFNSTDGSILVFPKNVLRKSILKIIHNY